MLIFDSLLFSFAVTVSLVHAAANDCTREALISTRDKFWEAAKSGNQPANLGKSVKIALNNKPETSLSTTPFSHVKSSTWTPFQAQAVDTEICEIATFK